MAAWIGPAITAAATFASRFLGGGKSSAEKKQNYYNEALNQLQLNDAMRYDRAGGVTHRIRMQVNDAKKAGLHPLFALGGAAPGPLSFIPGQSETGGSGRDAVAAGISAAGSAASEYFEGKQRKSDAERAEQLADLQAKRTEAEIQLLNAQTAKVSQEALNKRPVPAEVYGIKDAPKRPPLRMKFKNEDGTYTELYNPEAGLDEVSQFDFFMQGLRQFLMGPEKYDREGNRRWKGTNRH